MLQRPLWLEAVVWLPARNLIIPCTVGDDRKIVVMPNVYVGTQKTKNRYTVLLCGE